MNDTSLQDYVRNARANGTTDEALRASLTSAGWAPGDVDAALGMPSATVPAAPRRRTGLLIALAAVGGLAIVGGVAAYVLQRKPDSKSTPPAPISSGETPRTMFSSDPAQALIHFEWADGAGKNYILAISGNADLREGAETTYQGTLLLSDSPPSGTPRRTRFSSFFALAKETFYASFRQGRESVPPADRLVSGGWARASREDVSAALEKVAPKARAAVLPWIDITPDKLRRLRQALAASGAVTLTEPAEDVDPETGTAVHAGAIDPEKFETFLLEAHRIVTGREPDASARQNLSRTAARFADAIVIGEVQTGRKDVTRIGAMLETPPEGPGLTGFSIIWMPMTEPFDTAYRSATATLDAFIK